MTRTLAGDHAEVVALKLTSGSRVELMRTSFKSQVFPRHTHEYFTLGVILGGVGTIWYRGAEHLAEPGDVVVIPPGEVHTGGSGPGGEALSYLAAHLPESMLAPFAESGGLASAGVPGFRSPVLRDRAIASSLRRLDGLVSMRARVVDEDAADDALTSAVGLLLRHAAEATPRTTHGIHEPDFVRRTRETIEECYGDRGRTSLNALALEARVTPFHLVRLFTQTVGLSPHRYVVQTRIRRARQLLARGIQPSFVAAMTGFVDQSHLTTQFKRYVGTTPALYQRGMGNREADRR